MYLPIKMFEFASGVAKEKLALDPDGEAEDVGEEQRAVKRDALEVAMNYQVAPRCEKVQRMREPKSECKEKESRDEDSVGKHRRQFPKAWSS